MIQIANTFLIPDFVMAIVKETPEKWWKLGQKKKWGTWSGDSLGCVSVLCPAHCL